MSLSPGRTLAHYEILESIGAGGQGEVYRARDTKLGRDVAIKVLPEEFSKDKERLDRFEREARLLAQLNHTNIATLHGLEESDGQRFLVMEFEIYLRPFPPAGDARWQLTSDGGEAPKWRGDGRELFYVAPGSRFMALSVSLEARPEWSSPVQLFQRVVRRAPLRGSPGELPVTPTRSIHAPR